MMSRTVRYMKLLYIVAGILMSNESVCETVDQLQITPRVEVKEILRAPCRRLSEKEKSSVSPPSTSSAGGPAGGGTAADCRSSERLAKGGSHLTAYRSGIKVSWIRHLYEPYLNIFRFRRIRERLLPWIWAKFNVWAIPNHLLCSSSSYISRKVFLLNDCDKIYNK